MALHPEDHGSHQGIGEAIAGPEQDPNVAGWREFLKKPENLSTALVLLAGITSPKSRGQTNLNKALVSGVGALGFRGGLEKGVAGQRAETRKEQRTIDQQQAELAAGQAVTSQGAERNRIAGRQVDVQQQLATQAGQPRPLNPSERTRNLSQAELARAQAAAIASTEAALSFETIFGENLALAKELSRDGTIDMNAIAAQTLQQVDMNKLAAMGALVVQHDTDPDSPTFGEETISFDTEKIPPERLGEFRHLIPDPEAAPDGTIPKGDELPATQEIAKTLRVSGRFNNTAAGQETTVHVMRAQGDFEELSDDEILDVLAKVRGQIQDRETLKAMEVEQLEELLTVYGRVLTIKEKSNIRRALKAKTGTTFSAVDRITKSGAF